MRYHCTKRADVDLCPAAFAEGRFPAGTCARDFVRINAPAQPQVQCCCVVFNFLHSCAPFHIRRAFRPAPA